MYTLCFVHSELDLWGYLRPEDLIFTFSTLDPCLTGSYFLRNVIGCKGKYIEKVGNCRERTKIPNNSVFLKMGAVVKIDFAETLTHWGFFVLGVSLVPHNEKSTPWRAKNRTKKCSICSWRWCASFALKVHWIRDTRREFSPVREKIAYQYITQFVHLFMYW